MKRFLNKYWAYILISVAALSICWPLLNRSLFFNHDGIHSIRMLSITECFVDGQIPCRWSKDLGWGNGYPLFNYYGPGPYYLGALFSYLTGYIIAEKILIFLTLVLAGFGMFLLVNSLWGRLPAVLSSILYIYAPYRALDIYVRGTLTEAFAIAILPFLFFLIKKAIEEDRFKYYLWFCLTGFFFLITHNIMTVLFAPILFVWTLLILKQNNWKNIWKLTGFGVMAVGLSAFFLFPAFIEKNLVRVDQLVTGYFDYRNHFLSIWKMFIDRGWGYWGNNYSVSSSMSFQLGLPYWPLAILAGIYLIFLGFRKKINIIPILFFVFFAFSVFMMHNKSIFIWERLPLLQFFQFPWRFLALSIFTSSVLGGYLLTVVKKTRIKTTIFIILLGLTALLNWNYFKPERYLTKVNEANLFTGDNWEKERSSLTFDYLPRTAIEPREAAPELPIIRSGKAKISEFVNRSNKWHFLVVVENNAQIEVPVYYFPNWKVYVNGKIYPFSYKENIGRISLKLPTGEYFVDGKFTNTPIRSVANIITLISFVGLIGLTIYAKNKKLFK